MSILTLIAPVVTYWATVWIVSVGLIVWAVWSGLRLFVASRKIRGALDRGRRALESVPNAQAFASQWPRIRKELESVELLENRWREWTETLVVRRGPDQSILATSRPAEWFDLGLYADAGADLRYHAALPSLLVGAGLLFTFLGLAVALDSAGALVTAETAALRNDALRTLLDTASFKFVASLVGLLCSIGYALFRKRQLRRSEESIARFCDALERHTHFVTPALLQAQAQEGSEVQLRLLAAAQKELQGIGTTLASSQQTHERIFTEVQLFNQGLAVNLGEALDKVFDQRLGEHLEKLARVLDERLGQRFERLVESLAAQIQGRDQRGVLELLQQLVERLEAGSAGHMQTVAAELAGLGGRLGEISTALQGAAAGLKHEVDAAATALGTSVQQVGESMSAGAGQAAAQLERAVAGLVETLRAPAELLARESSQLASAASGLDQGLARLRGLVAELGEPLERAATGFDGAAVRLRDAVLPLQDAAQHGTETAERLERAAGELQRLLDGQAQLAGRLDEAARGFAEVDESLAGTVQSLRLGLDGFAEKVGEVVRAVDSELAKAVSGLHGLVSDLEDAVQAFHDRQRAN